MRSIPVNPEMIAELLASQAERLETYSVLDRFLIASGDDIQNYANNLEFPPTSSIGMVDAIQNRLLEHIQRDTFRIKPKSPVENGLLEQITQIPSLPSNISSGINPISAVATADRDHFVPFQTFPDFVEHILSGTGSRDTSANLKASALFSNLGIPALFDYRGELTFKLKPGQDCEIVYADESGITYTMQLVDDSCYPKYTISRSPQAGPDEIGIRYNPYLSSTPAILDGSTNISAVNVMLAYAMIAKAACPDAQKIVELGVGSGLQLSILGNLYPTASLYGVDIRSDLCNMAKTNIRTLDKKLAKCGAAKLTPRTEVFDYDFLHQLSIDDLRQKGPFDIIAVSVAVNYNDLEPYMGLLSDKGIIITPISSQGESSRSRGDGQKLCVYERSTYNYTPLCGISFAPVHRFE